MGVFRISAPVRALAILAAAVVLTLNTVLLADAFGIAIPGLPAG
jgi:hypothetical protein